VDEGEKPVASKGKKQKPKADDAKDAGEKELTEADLTPGEKALSDLLDKALEKAKRAVRVAFDFF
jgi:hypothetical protein